MGGKYERCSKGRKKRDRRQERAKNGSRNVVEGSCGNVTRRVLRTGARTSAFCSFLLWPIVARQISHFLQNLTLET